MKVVWLICGLLLCVSAGAEPSARPFQVGEKLHYRIFWGPVPVGAASLEVRNIEPVDGHDCYHLVAEARTVGLGRLLFKLESATESWLDTEGLFTRQFRQGRREGKHERYAITTYDYARKEAVTTNLKNGRERRTPIESPVQDIISSLYYVRAQPLDVNREEKFVVHNYNKNWNVSVRPDQRQKLTISPFGEINALRLEPNPPLKIVSANNGRMWFWVSDDARKLPLIVNSTMAIGSAKLVLHKIESAATAAAPLPASQILAAHH